MTRLVWLGAVVLAMVRLAPVLMTRKTYSNRIRVCSLVVHEFGHLLGLGHSDDSDSVMFASERTTVRACFDRFIGRNARRDRRVFGDRGWSTR